ncbi:MAG: hypothetical protein ACYC40_00900 [Patescibacteria group bacterium]
MLKIFKKNSSAVVFWIFFYFFIFCLLLKSGFSYLDPDLGWHLRVGEGISITHQVPSQNIYNYTYTGTWVDHEWLSNYLIFQIYNNLGYPALVTFFVLLIIAVLVLLNLAVTYLWRLRGKNPPVILIVLFQLFGVLASIPHFGVRIQELALLFLLLVLFSIYFYNKNKNYFYLLFLVPLFYLWSCLHASFLIGLLIVFSWAGIKLGEKIIISSKLNKYFKNYIDLNDVLEYHHILVFIVIAIMAALATLLTPYHLELYSFLSGYSDTLYLSYVQEWLSQFCYPFFYWQLFYLSLASLALFIYIFYIKKIKINLWFSFIFLLFFILSFKSRRHFPLFFVSTFTLLIYVYSEYVEAGIGKIKEFPKWLRFYLLTCLFLTGLFILSGINYVRDPFYSKAFSQDYPIEAVSFIDRHREYDNLKIFNKYNWGGFLIYVNPNRQIFIDGRLPQVFYQGHSFLEEYLEFFGSDLEIQQQIEKYDIRLILMSADDKKVGIKKWEKFFFAIKESELNPVNKFRVYLDKTAGWQVVYRDNTAVIYIRK